MIGILLAALAIVSSCSPVALYGVPLAIWVVGAVYAVTEDEQRELEREQLRARIERRALAPSPGVIHVGAPSDLVLIGDRAFNKRTHEEVRLVPFAARVQPPPPPPPTRTPGPGERMYR